MQLTMTRELPTLRDLVVPPAPRGLRLLPPHPSLADELAGLLFEGYGEGPVYPDLPAARADVAGALAGEYGPLDTTASALALEEEPDALVAAVLAVRSAGWEDVRGMPFVTDLVTVPRRRGQGVGRWLLARCLSELSASGAHQVGLRVESENIPAVTLYRSMGFAPR